MILDRYVLSNDEDSISNFFITVKDKSSKDNNKDHLHVFDQVCVLV